MTAGQNLPTITPQELHWRIAAGTGPFILDVRTPAEYSQGHIPGARLIPMDEIPLRCHELDPRREVILVCRSGNRSGQVQEWLWRQGYRGAVNMVGGMLQWTGPIEV